MKLKTKQKEKQKQNQNQKEKNMITMNKSKMYLQIKYRRTIYCKIDIYFLKFVIYFSCN